MEPSKVDFQSPDRKGGDKNECFIRFYALLAPASILIYNHAKSNTKRKKKPLATQFRRRRRGGIPVSPRAILAISFFYEVFITNST